MANVRLSVIYSIIRGDIGQSEVTSATGEDTMQVGEIGSVTVISGLWELNMDPRLGAVGILCYSLYDKGGSQATSG